MRCLGITRYDFSAPHIERAADFVGKSCRVMVRLALKRRAKELIFACACSINRACTPAGFSGISSLYQISPSFSWRVPSGSRDSISVGDSRAWALMCGKSFSGFPCYQRKPSF